MDTKVPENALNPEEELKKLREKTDKSELGELRHGLLGGYKSRDVAAYVERLKDQLQTAERTFKGRIAELSQEKEKLKGENSALTARIAQMEQEDGKRAHKKAAEDAEEAMRGATENIALLKARVSDLELDLQREQAAAESLQAEKESLQSDYAGLNARLDAETAEHDRLLNESHRQNKELRDQAEALIRANGGLANQLEVSRQNILEALAEKEKLEKVNEELRKSLNSLVIRADAAVQENEALGAQLSAEREKAQRYQELYDSIADMLTRVRTAGRMLDERILEMDKTLSWGVGQASKPTTGAHKKTKAELLDFNEGKGPAVKELVTELKSIQGGLAQ